MKLINDNKADVCLIIDYSNLAYRAYFTSENKSVRQEYFLKKVYEIIESFKDNKTVSIVFAMDTSPTRKKQIYPLYKANRKSNPDPKNEFLETVSKIRCRVIKMEGEEADDVVATFAKKCFGQVVICSGDQDFWQLGSRYKIFNLTTMSILRQSDCIDKYGVGFDGIVLFKSFFGDSGDNIKPAADRIRKSVLIDVINQSKTKNDFYMMLISSKNKMSENESMKIAKSSDRFDLNYSLVKLKEDLDDIFETKHEPTLEETADFIFKNAPSLSFYHKFLSGNFSTFYF